jgi:hypothetical protein
MTHQEKIAQEKKHQKILRARALKLNHDEASWLAYCLEYVDACYTDDELNIKSKERIAEIKRGRRVLKRLEKLFMTGVSR